ncbi:hypothetical protein KOW79_011402 [Hemibagrus wyckioides]|uniref:Galanin domain-containing protein n=1 Tax=Hemibagrus wyckioides TaxID=337641 RepID=A0A9D3SHY3_9TELE|nr:hypothetical protein KOW79_011402 [Hemibagrus wyckioides]
MRGLKSTNKDKGKCSACPSHITLPSRALFRKMQMSYMLFWVSLCVLSPQLSQTHGMRLRGLEKRGWTLNSAGYLLGPYAHRTLTVRHGGSVGKRESTEDFVLPTPQPSYMDFSCQFYTVLSSFFGSVTDESYLHALIEFLTYLRMKDNKSIEEVISSTFTDDGT